MAIQSKPIPALYVVYILRSTVRHASLYIGSTPHPPRRLNQHNGLTKGGASRTARDGLRPWEMVGVVSGFTSMVGALKFEWALNNPHLSLHIAPEDRIVLPTQRRRNGRPKRPQHSVTSILSNLHLLLRVPSFARWPLNLHFFDRPIYRKWEKYCEGPDRPPLRRSLKVLTDFAPVTPAEAEQESQYRSQAVKKLLQKGFMEQEEGDDEDDRMALMEGNEDVSASQARGVYALPLDYAPLGAYVEKAHNITSFEREGKCVVCHQDLEHDKGLYAICSNGSCEGVGHLDCWSRHLLHQKGEDDSDAVLLPIDGQCPKCCGTVKWADMMKELTLRIRGQKEVETVLKRRKRAATAKKSKAVVKAPVKSKAPTRSRVPVAAKVSTMDEVLAIDSPSPKRKAPRKEKARVGM